jgi:hypothetical protein
MFIPRVSPLISAPIEKIVRMYVLTFLNFFHQLKSKLNYLLLTTQMSVMEDGFTIVTVSPCETAP